MYTSTLKSFKSFFFFPLCIYTTVDNSAILFFGQIKCVLRTRGVLVLEITIVQRHLFKH